MTNFSGKFCGAALVVAALNGVATAQTVTTFDVLVVTGSLTASSTATIQGDAFSVGLSTLVVINGNVGIGTTTPDFPLHMVGPNVLGGKGEFRWIPKLSALRVGEVTGAQWNEVNTGNRSVAFGFNNTSDGDYSTIAGG